MLRILLLLFILSASFASKSVIINTTNNPKFVDVVIIGAGASGMSAATSLIQFSTLSFVVLEGKTYTGGRVHARKFGTPTIHIEEGANWVHGEPPPGGTSRMVNPAWKLAKQVNLSMIRIPGSCANTSGYSLYTSNGTLYSNINGDVQQKADAAFKCANITGSQLKNNQDISFQQALKGCGFNPPLAGSVQDTLFWEITAANLPMDIDRESLKWALPDPTYMYFGPDDHFVHEQKNTRGYAAILDAMFDTSKDHTVFESSLQLETDVLEIAATPLHSICRPGQVWIRTTKINYCSKYVISTLPLGVMQQDHSNIFTSPPLSKTKVHGLESFDMGNFTKIFIQFEKNFWSHRGQQFLIANTVTANGDILKGRRNPMEFHDLGSLIEGSNTLFTYVTGQDCNRWSLMTDDKALHEMVELLKIHFPNVKMLPKVTSFYMTRHYEDKYMRGAYSVSKVGVTNKEFNEMVEPHGKLK
jgi:polyamine oxidase